MEFFSDLGISQFPSRKGATIKPRIPLAWFWVGVSAFVVASLFVVQSDSVETILGAALIGVAALLPGYLWLSGKANGLPIFPIFALTYLWTYALPLVINHPEVVQYSPENHVWASLTTSGFLFLGTFVWFQFVRLATPASPLLRVFDGNRAEPYLLAGLSAGVVFSISFTAGWSSMDAGLYALIRGSVYAINNLSMFVLAYRWGTLELSKQKTGIFLSLLAFYIIANSASLLLVNALSALLLVAIAFSLGRRRIPYLPILILGLVVIPLHYGKAEMRQKYWNSAESANFQPWDYPSIFAEWSGYSYRHLFQSSDDSTGDSPQAITQRAGLVNLLLLAHERTSNGFPFLDGATYAIIPRLLVPRFIDPNKPASHEGTYLLNIHFGLQTREDTYTTTIGWGLLNEAYANFGLWGVGGLAIALGSMYGLVARWSSNCPVLSARYLFSILLISTAFQSEFSASVFVTALFQSTMPLLVLSFLLMKRTQNSQSNGGTPVDGFENFPNHLVLRGAR